MSGLDTKEMRDLLTRIKSREGSAVLNLYAINDRASTMLVLVVAHGSEEALDHIRRTSIDWDLATTVTRRIQRNVSSPEGVLTAVGMHGQADRFRLNLSVSKDHPAYNPDRRAGGYRIKRDRTVLSPNNGGGER